MIDRPLFDTDEAGAHNQWRIESMQLVNWGGFDGPHKITFSPKSTLISGDSGAGKSTLLDAYTSLMMPPGTSFNAASNDAVTGRARSESQRNNMTYLRGKRDEAQVGNERSATMLRGPKDSVWGAIAATFVNGDGRRFTPFRTFFAAMGAVGHRDVIARMFTVDGPFDLKDLAPLADSRFTAKAVQDRFTGVRPHDSNVRFVNAITTTLDIGAGDDGKNALLILNRIQRSGAVASVHELYRDRVLGRPGTFDAADTAWAEFQRLVTGYEQLESEHRKQQKLEPIRKLYGQYADASADSARLGRFGVDRPLDKTPFQLWRHRTEYDLLAVEIDANARERVDAEAQLKDTDRSAVETEATVEDLIEQRRSNGGDAIARIEADLRSAKAARRQVEAAVARFYGPTKVLGIERLDAEVYADLRTVAATHMDHEQDRATELLGRRDELVRQQPSLEQEHADLSATIKNLQSRRSIIPVPYDQVRAQVAHECGLTPEELPYAAELMSVGDAFADWRLAAEVTLHGVGLTMLMDERREQMVRRTINGLKNLHPRFQFDGVNLHRATATPSDPRMISGRLVFKEDSPFVDWVKQRVQQGGTDHLCVEVGDLGGPGARVTKEGQTSRGTKGAAGRNRGQSDILGFSNEQRIADLTEQAHNVATQLEAIAGSLRDISVKQERHSQLTRAYRTVLDTDWADLDLDAADDRISELDEERADLLAGSDALRQIEARLREARAQLNSLVERRGSQKAKRDALTSRWEHLIARQDRVGDERDSTESSGLVFLSDEDHRYLDERLENVAVDLTSDRFQATITKLRDTLINEGTARFDEATTARNSLERIFREYNEQWPGDPNRGATIADYEQFLAIYDRITRDGLGDRREVWKRQLQKWSGEDLTPLFRAFGRAMTDIEDRLDPINDILRGLPFGARREHLRIAMRRLNPEHLVQFRKRLSEAVSNLTVEMTDEQAERRYQRLRGLMDQLARPEGGRSSARRDELLDVRRHIEITAVRVDAEGNDVATYSTLGEKSGGESQELVAFILGSALRFQLGDATRSYPQFAPVFLDEAFVKADHNFAGRAVNAWLGLGFQLIVSTPTGQVPALYPHIDTSFSISKNEAKGYSYITPFTDAPERPAA